MKRREVDDGWFLIDFVDAAQSPRMNTHIDMAQLSNRLEHAPEIFVAGGSHTTAVDVWGVGLLIDSCTELAGQQWHDYGERTQFLLKLLAVDPTQRPHAADALTELMRLQANHKKQYK